MTIIDALESAAPVTQAPAKADFALIELGVMPDGLALLYGEMRHTGTGIQWRSLFEHSAWQASWHQGPILIEVRDHGSLTKQLIDRLETQPGGLVIVTQSSLEELLSRCQQWLFCRDQNQQRLLRFYDPRRFAPLIASLDPATRALLIPPNRLCREQWFAHDGFLWRSAQSPSDASEHSLFRQTDHDSPAQPHVSPEQLEQTEVFHHEALAAGFANHYAKPLSDYPTPRQWTLSQLKKAHTYGLSGTAVLERWLRLALRLGPDFDMHPKAQAVLSREDWSPERKLDSLESSTERP